MTKPEIYGIIGNPVRHSLSPLIHNFLFKKYKINASYHLFEVEESKLQKAIDGIRILGIKGVNVTSPYKEKVLPFLDEIKNETKIIGAVNTIQNVGGRLTGYNTDIYGIKKSLGKKHNFLPQGRKVAILGAGGAAKACIFTLLKYNPKEVLIFNRSFKKAEQLKEKFSKFSKSTILSFFSLKELPEVLAKENIFLLINAISGKSPLIKSTYGELLNDSKNRTKIFDLTYNFSGKDKIFIRKSRFLDGTYMLVAQALESFYIWTKIRPEFNPIFGLVTKTLKSGNYA